MKRFLMTLFIVFAVAISQTKWDIDSSHSTIAFSITHLVISDVQGKFDSFKGSITSKDDDFTNSKIMVEIDVLSINTSNAKRDKHLKTEEFFNTKKFPKMIFKSSSMKRIKKNSYKLLGNLSLHGITKEIELMAKFKGIVKDPWGNTRAGFKVEGKLNRYDFDLKYNSLMEAGGLVISNEVRILFNLELVKRKK